MHTHPSEASEAIVPSESRGRGRRRRTDWRLGGSTVRGWREMLLAWSVLGLGLGILAGYAVVAALPTAPWAGAAATVLLWLGMLVPIVLALRRSRPIGLFRFRATDLLVGVAFGIVLRLGQGWFQQTVQGEAGFPGILLIDGRIPASWWLLEALPTGIVAPVIEELFFRVVLLVALYTLLRRPFGHVAAGIAAASLTTVAFVAVHLIGGMPSSDALLSLTLVGAVCAVLVLLTGRIWPAVLAHVVYNVSGLALAVVGALAG